MSEFVRSSHAALQWIEACQIRAAYVDIMALWVVITGLAVVNTASSFNPDSSANLTLILILALTLHISCFADSVADLFSSCQILMQCSLHRGEGGTSASGLCCSTVHTAIEFGVMLGLGLGLGCDRG